MELQDLSTDRLESAIRDLRWMTLPEGYVSNDACGITDSLAVARAVHAQLISLGLTYRGVETYGRMNRMIEFSYTWIYRPDGGLTTYGRSVLMVLTAVSSADVPPYEVVDQRKHQRQGSVFNHLEVDDKRYLFPEDEWWIRPTLVD